MQDIKVPLTVPAEKREEYLSYYDLVTHGTGRLFLFAGDQKIEHLNNDFYGEGISPEDADPEHMFQIASKAKIGAFASQLGLIARYGMDYKDVPYIVKLNSKSHLVKTSQADPISLSMIDVHRVAEFKQTSGLNIVGIGYTIYIGSQYEYQMMTEAAMAIHQAQKHGLLSVVWAYPRGKAVPDEKDPHIIAGAAGAVACLGADFVKVNYPKKEGIALSESLKEAVLAAGRTKLICAGGSSMDAPKFFQTLYDQIHTAGASGNATGRNIHQRPLDEAIRFSNAIYAITIEDKSVEEAMKIYNGNQ